MDKEKKYRNYKKRKKMTVGEIKEFLFLILERRHLQRVDTKNNIQLKYKNIIEDYNKYSNTKYILNYLSTIEGLSYYGSCFRYDYIFWMDCELEK